MADHDDHIHVGFQPLFGANAKLGMQALAVLKPGQWDDLVARLREIDNPTVPTKPSKYAHPGQEARAAATRTTANSPTAFPFVQFEFGFLLGPHDGRYLRRGGPEARA